MCSICLEFAYNPSLEKGSDVTKILSPSPQLESCHPLYILQFKPDLDGSCAVVSNFVMCTSFLSSEPTVYMTDFEK